MQRVLLVLLTRLVPVVSAVTAVQTATAAGAESKTKAVTSVIGDAGPDRWVNEGGPYGGNVYSVAVAASSPNIVYAGSSNGLYVSTDGAETWKPVKSLRVTTGQLIVEDVEVDPTDSRIVYACGGQNGLHKSTDGGATWVEIKPDPRRRRAVRLIEIDPRTPSTLYASDVSRGVYKSMDGGQTWNLMSSGLFNPGFWRMHIDPHYPNVIYGVTATKRAVFTSRNGGKTWRRDFGNITNISLGRLKEKRDAPGEFTITILRDGKNVFRSRKGGRAWQKVSGSLRGLFPERLTINPNDPRQVQLTLCQYGKRDVFLTVDGARSWHLVRLPFDGGGELRGLRVDPNRSHVLYTGTRAGVFYFSRDWGKTWKFLYSEKSDPAGTHAAAVTLLRPLLFCGLKGKGIAYAGLTVDPTKSNVIYYADRTVGVFKSDNGGQTWSRKNHGLVAFCAAGIACDIREAGFMYTCATSGIYKSVDGGRTWKQTGMHRGYTFPIAIHPLDSRIVLVAKRRLNYTGVLMSTDRGETWNNVPALSRSGRIANFLFDLRNADTFYVQAKNALLETNDRGRTWRRRRSVERPHFYGYCPIVRQTNAGIIYLVRGTDELWRSTNVGMSWTKTADLHLKGGIEVVQVHAYDPRIVALMGARGQLRFSTNAGATWRSINVMTDSRRACCIALHPRDPDVFYIAAHGPNAQLLRTRDGGETFDKPCSGLPAGKINHIEISLADGAVYAAIHGAGVYRLEILGRSKRGENEG